MPDPPPVTTAPRPATSTGYLVGEPDRPSAREKHSCSSVASSSVSFAAAFRREPPSTVRRVQRVARRPPRRGGTVAPCCPSGGCARSRRRRPARSARPSFTARYAAPSNRVASSGPARARALGEHRDRLAVAQHGLERAQRARGRRCRARRGPRRACRRASAPNGLANSSSLARKRIVRVRDERGERARRGASGATGATMYAPVGGTLLLADHAHPEHDRADGSAPPRGRTR